ncbi:hypothetical protein EV182_000236 [Spiromyces aspiralis]|uniref:Uncharacterized protein n=1 Tax=Spiromyces aspiralis TaxID=68401 RepID=A0ACC1HXC2_9FUNG|nr:hypothetical protein EV182_000236 [Spiromyces aspiralis]
MCAQPMSPSPIPIPAALAQSSSSASLLAKSAPSIQSHLRYSIGLLARAPLLQPCAAGEISPSPTHTHRLPPFNCSGPRPARGNPLTPADSDDDNDDDDYGGEGPGGYSFEPDVPFEMDDEDLGDPCTDILRVDAYPVLHIKQGENSNLLHTPSSPFASGQQLMFAEPPAGFMLPPTAPTAASTSSSLHPPQQRKLELCGTTNSSLYNRNPLGIYCHDGPAPDSGHGRFELGLTFDADVPRSIFPDQCAPDHRGSPSCTANPCRYYTARDYESLVNIFPTYLTVSGPGVSTPAASPSPSSPLPPSLPPPPPPLSPSTNQRGATTAKATTTSSAAIGCPKSYHNCPHRPFNFISEYHYRNHHLYNRIIASSQSRLHSRIHCDNTNISNYYQYHRCRRRCPRASDPRNARGDKRPLFALARPETLDDDDDAF